MRLLTLVYLGDGAILWENSEPAAFSEALSVGHLHVLMKGSVFTVFQKKKKKTQADADLYSLPTRQGESSFQGPS